MCRIIDRSLVAVLVLCFLAGSTWGQESRANIEGRVTDPQGAAVPGAEVIVVAQETNVKQSTTTNEQGSWTVRFLNPGSYRILVSASGFKTSERKGIVLQVADMKQVDVVLEIGQVSETVTVTAEAALIDTTAATSGTVIETDAVTEFLAAVTPRAERHPIPGKVAYHSPCHLGHAQGIQDPPRALLRAIPGMELVEVPEGDQCCGSAGIYNLVQVAASDELGARKAANVLATGAPFLASANPGCTLQVQRVLREKGASVQAAHPIEILDASIQGKPFPGRG